MKRVLKRHMFRLGGNTDQGIMSGVVPRQGYQGTNNPADQRVMSDYEKKLIERVQAGQRVSEMFKQPKGRSDLSKFLIDFGLETASTPPSGSIFATTAKTARGPFERYMGRQETRKTEDERFNQALIGDVMEQMSKEKEYGEKGKTFAFEREQESYENLIAEQRRLEEALREAKRTKGPSGKPGGQVGPDPEEIRRLEEQLEDNAKLQSKLAGKEEDPVRQAILKGIANGVFTFEDLIIYDQTGVPPRDEAATGGRVGYLGGGQAMPEQTQPVMNPAATGNDLTFQELRSRLPETVSDDIVQLLVNSEEALVEFANIQTERDIATFNRKYQVNLVLPQEA